MLKLTRNMRSLLLCASSLLFTCIVVVAKEEPTIVLQWPPDQPSIKLTFGKFKQLFKLADQNTYLSDVTVENLTDKAFPRVTFTVYLMDKNKVRIGDGILQVSNINPRQQVKVGFQVNSLGVPSTLSLAAKKDMLSTAGIKTTPVRVISIPPGAKLKVDGQDAGTTPIMVKFAEGTHTLEFNKEGFATGSMPLDITPDELPGGSITFELGGLSKDTVELRDGTVLLGDVISLSLTQAVVRVNGEDQTYDRNRIKKLILVERQVIQPQAVKQPIVVPPSPPQP